MGAVCGCESDMQSQRQLEQRVAIKQPKCNGEVYSHLSASPHGFMGRAGERHPPQAAPRSRFLLHDIMAALVPTRA
jgi:hypothetical protein